MSKILLWGPALWFKGAYSRNLLNMGIRLIDAGHEVSQFAFGGLRWGIVPYPSIFCSNCGHLEPGKWEETDCPKCQGKRKRYVIDVYPNGADDYGQTWLSRWARFMGTEVIIFHYDSWALGSSFRDSDLPIIWYSPVDHSPLPPPTKESLEGSGKVIAMTRFAEKELKHVGIKSTYIPHAIDPRVYCQKDRIEARRRLNFPEDAFILTSVACYDDKTEVLTKEGWKLFSEVTNSDEVATANNEGFLEYQKPLEIYRCAYKGPLLHFISKCLDLLVTPDHRMWIRGKGKTNYEFMEAIFLASKRSFRDYRFKRGAKWVGSEVKSFTIPRLPAMEEMPERMREYEVAMALSSSGGLGAHLIANEMNIPKSRVANWIHAGAIPERDPQVPNELGEISIDLWLKFFGWWITEGSLKPRKRTISISQRNVANAGEILETIREIGFKPYYDGKQNIMFKSKQLLEYLKQFGHSHEKFIPVWVKNLPAAKLKILSETMLKGDGHGVKLYTTSSKRLADDVQEISIKLGYGATISKTEISKINPNWHDKYRVNISTKWQEYGATSVNTVNYEGNVYCVEVPNGKVFVRRNGKEVICGNTNKGPRKNLGNLLRAYKMFLTKTPEAEKDVFLYLHCNVSRGVDNPIGYELPQIWNGLGIAERIKYIHPVYYEAYAFTDDEMADVYSSSDWTVLCSLGEGFGMPLIESLACGTPVIYGNFSSMPEVVGPGGLPVNAVDRMPFELSSSFQWVPSTKQLADRIGEAYQDWRNGGKLRDELGAKGRKHVLRRYSWDRTMPKWLASVEAEKKPEAVELKARGERVPGEVDIILLTYNRLDFLEQCYNAIHEHTTVPFHLIIMDDQSTDGDKTYLWAKELWQREKNVTYVRRDVKARGGSEIMNAGFKYCRNDLIVSMNNDILVTDGWLENSVKCMEDPLVGIVGMKFLWPWDEKIQHAGGTFVKGEYPVHIGAAETAEFHSDTREVLWVSGPCVLIRRAALEPGWSEDYESFGGHEDVDLCLRARSQGWKVLYCGTSVVYHYEGATVTKLPGFDEMFNNARMIFSSKWRGDPLMKESSLRPEER